MKLFRTIYYLFPITSITMILFCCSNNNVTRLISDSNFKSVFDSIQRQYFNQPLPTTTPLLFDIPSMNSGFEYGAVFSPDGNEFYFNRLNTTTNRWQIFFIKRTNGVWDKQAAPAGFSNNNYNEANPAFSPDGKKIFWCSNRSLTGEESVKNNFDIWCAERIGNDWSAPIHLPSPVKSNYREDYPSVAPDGTLYFSSNRPGGYGDLDIFKSTPVNGIYSNVENLGNNINSIKYEMDVEAACSDYLLFVSGNSNDDLYISYKDESGKFSKAVLLPQVINSSSDEYGARLTPDKKYLFFTRSNGANRKTYWIDVNIFSTYK